MNKRQRDWPGQAEAGQQPESAHLVRRARDDQNQVLQDRGDVGRDGGSDLGGNLANGPRGVVAHGMVLRLESAEQQPEALLLTKGK